MIEHWRDIEGFESLYKVSSFGRVYSLPKKGTDGRNLSGRFMSSRMSTTGKRQYPQTCLTKDGVDTYAYIHRLVAKAFKENANGYPEVNHIDQNKVNNHIDNLEWVSAQQNTEHSHSKTYLLKLPSNEEVIVFNLRKFCRENNLDRHLVKKWIVARL